jgi:hypothetical protein
MKKLSSIAAVLLSLAAMTSAVGSTGTDNLGNVKIGTDDEFAFASTKPPATFSDSVNFDLISSGALVTDSLLISGITGLKISLYNDTAGSYVFSCTSHCALTDTFAGLTKSDDYSLIISGQTSGPGGSSSTVFGSLSVTAVPEPGTTALLIAGLGLLGLTAWRRRRRDDSSSALLAR